MMQLVIAATRNPLGDGRYALAIAWPDQTRNVKRTHPPPRLVTQSLQKRLEPMHKPHLPVGPLHGRPLHKPTTHESLKSRFVNPHPHPEKQKSAKVVLAPSLSSTDRASADRGNLLARLRAGLGLLTPGRISSCDLQAMSDAAQAHSSARERILRAYALTVSGPHKCALRIGWLKRSAQVQTGVDATHAVLLRRKPIPFVHGSSQACTTYRLETDLVSRTSLRV